jgi:hypothetical protein
VSAETRQLLDRGVLLSERGKIEDVYRFKRNMLIANVLCPLVILGLSICIFFGYLTRNLVVYDIGNYGWVSVLSVFTIIWGWTLYTLYRDTVHSRKLLPNSRIFILHGSLLAFFLLEMAFINIGFQRETRAQTLKGY